LTLIQIPTLPPDLRQVPDYDDDPDTYATRYFAWRDRVVLERVQTQLLCKYGDSEHSAAFYQTLELELCAADPARFIAFWLWIEEPRPTEVEDTVESPIKPYVPFAFQVELAQWWVEKTSQPGRYDGFVSKARGLGATWIFCACATWAWLFREWRGTLVSRKEDLVDKPKDVNSMFGKIDFILDHLPDWMLPAGFDPERGHRLKNFLTNPTSMAAIAGEATTAKTGRGARATYIIYDEAAFVPSFRDVFGTGAGTTYHRWCVSSESFEEGDDWYHLWHDTVLQRTPDRVRQLDYWLNPYFTPHWMAQEQIAWEHDPHGFQREFLRDPFAGFGQWVYPDAHEKFVRWDESDFPHSPHPFYDPRETLLVGIDPGRADDTAIVFMQFSGDESPRTARWIDSYSCNLQPAEYYAHVLTGIPPRPGEKCFGVRFDEEAERIMGWMRQLPWSGAMRVFCDPAGSQKDMSGLSFTDRLTITSKDLRLREIDRRIAEGEIKDPADAPRPVPIIPLYEELFGAQDHDKRRLALRPLLLRSVFSRTRGAKRLQQALQKYKFNEPGDNSTSQPKPVHDEHSHLVSAAEYIATYIDMGLGRIKPKRDRKKRTFTDPLTGRPRVTEA
jgi:hypothetical protein